MSPYIIFIIILIISMGATVYIYMRLRNTQKKLNETRNLYEGLKQNLESNINFAKQIADRDYSVVNTIGENDALGKSLVEMSTNLKTAELEDRKRSWAMAGLTRLAEIIRLSNHDLNELSNSLITFLVKYMNANQGGLFVINESNAKDKFLELKACYAFERKKFLEKRINLNEGLVGQAVIENETIYLTEIPQNYISITSGLGTANPNALIIVPLKTEESVVGALEIASFNAFEPHEREFLEKASESIASSILTSRINENTSKLLKESQDLTEQLRQQEEEVRQSMEELQATQDEMLRKEKEISKLLEESLKKEQLLEIKIKENKDLEAEGKKKNEEMLARIEHNRKIMTLVMNKLPQKIFLKNEEGRFLLLNEAVANDLNMSIEDLLGKNDFDLFSKEDAEKFWKAEKEEVLDKRNKIANYEDFEVDGVRKYFYTVKMPFKFPNSDVHGILGYQSDITELKNLETRIKNAEQENIAKQESMQLEIEALKKKLGEA